MCRGWVCLHLFNLPPSLGSFHSALPAILLHLLIPLAAKATAARDAASLRRAEGCVSDLERKNASLEAVVTFRESTPLCPSLHAMLADDTIHQ